MTLPRPEESRIPTLLSLGHGYTAGFLERHLPDWRIIGTTRDAERAAAFASRGVEPLLLPADLRHALAVATHLLISSAPGMEGDPFLALAGEAIGKAAPHLAWVGYLSSTGVYGDHGGGWVDETTPPRATEGHRDRRLMAEQAWQTLAAQTGLPLHIFRLAGIYGPGRGPFEKLRAGTAHRIVKEGQVFCRIHVEDAAEVLAASIARPDPGAIYNVCDDLPAPPQDVVEAAARMAGLPVPPAVPFDEAEMTPMARAFYRDNRRVRNDRIKRDLGVTLRYPTYREGLASLMSPSLAGLD